MNTTENNKIIAEFMEINTAFDDTFSINPMTKYGCWEKMKYDTDWNWLMEVVEKIESLGYDLFIETFEVRIEKYRETLFRQHTKVSNQTKIKAVYNACVEFIKWYNENK
jgi:hypothetical protein